MNEGIRDEVKRMLQERRGEEDGWMITNKDKEERPDRERESRHRSIPRLKKTVPKPMQILIVYFLCLAIALM